MADESAFDQMVCFGFYSAARQFGQVYRELLAPWDLTYTQYLVLIALWESDGRTVGGLGELLGLDSGTLSPVLKRLETRGFLTRARSGDDERVVAVTLTERGHQLRDELSGIPACLGERMGMTIPELRELLGTVHTLTGRLAVPV